ncbi:MAG TPA: hypothetical protein VM347_20965, partial [Nonomuraea sp.]|nr:hypothetical protein [Nonomuraea sp.]
DCQATDTGTRSTGDAAVVKPTDPAGQQVPDNGVGRVAPTDPPIQQVPDNGTGHASPTEPSGQRAADASAPTVGEPVVVGPTEPSVDQGGAVTPPATDAATPPVADTSTRATHATTVYAAAGADAATWGGDGRDVVSVDAKSLDSDALRNLVRHHRDVQPLGMPGVEVPPGEYGEGQWVLRDIQPDGPPGTIEPGTRERSV